MGKAVSPRGARRLAAAALCVIVAGALCGCAPRAQHPAVRTVTELLELRRADDRDATKYQRFFLESSIASALVEPGAVPTGTPRVPNWRSVYPSKIASGSAEVAVTWREDSEFKDWPAVTVFVLSYEDGRWVVVDAREETAAPEPVAK